MDRRSRNRICVWLIILGLSNFMAYAIIYAIIGGDAANGGIRTDAETGRLTYYVRGHHVRLIEGYETVVSRRTWIYSYLHSISIWPSIAAVLLAMLILARPHIIATYQDGIMRGATLVTVLATVIVVVTSLVMISFVAHFFRTLV